MSGAMHPPLAATPLLEVHHPDIEAQVGRRGRRTLLHYDRIGAVYDFVRNRVALGSNEGDESQATIVLADGIGQCHIKGGLLMALLRAVGIPAASTASPSTNR
jgi:transglutaminase-like putative cysteine protease